MNGTPDGPLTPASPDAEDLAILSQVLRDVARARRLSPEDAQDFAQTVHLRFLERRYDVFHRFGRQSSLRTYLTVVVTRLLLDWRNATYGKWRASAAAVRLGPHAVLLERLISRDGCTTDEAVWRVHASGSPVTSSELQQLAIQLPKRPRRQLVSDDALANVRDRQIDDPVTAEERRRIAGHVRRMLATAIRQLPPDDRDLIRLRYGHRHSVQGLAVALQTDPKSLYRRFDRTLRTLRRTLEAAGITGSGMLDRQ